MACKKTLKIWCGVNKNGFLSIHLIEPVRNTKYGKWVSNKMLCNSYIYEKLKPIFKNSNITWENDSEYFEIQL